MEEIILGLVQNNPTIAGYLMAVGLLRQIFKPTFMLIGVLAKRTENKTDDQIVEKIERSFAFKALNFLLDYTASIKLSTVLSDSKNGKGT